jgi:hypothetical protein
LSSRNSFAGSGIDRPDIQSRRTTIAARTGSLHHLHRLLAAAAVGVAHFVLNLVLGPSVHCAEARGCPDTEWIQAPPGDVFALPLSLARDSLASFFEGRSFAFYSGMNALSLALVVWAVLGALAWIRARR